MSSLEVAVLPKVTGDTIYWAKCLRSNIPSGAEEMYIHDTLRLMDYDDNRYMANRLRSTILVLQSGASVGVGVLMYPALDVYNWIHAQARADNKRHNGVQSLLPSVQPAVFDGVVLSSQVSTSFNAEALAIVKQDNELIAEEIGDETILRTVMSETAARAYVTAPLIVYRALHNQAQINALDAQFATSPPVQT